MAPAEGKIGIAIVVDQFSLFVPPEDQRYFLIGRQLYAGNAILYGYNEEGETVDLPLMPVVIFITRAGHRGGDRRLVRSTARQARSMALQFWRVAGTVAVPAAARVLHER